MPRAKATDGLSEAGWAAMLRGFAQGWTAERIAQAVMDATGETVTERTVARRAAEWRMEQERVNAKREDMRILVEEAKAGNALASDMIQALAQQALIDDPESVKGKAFYGRALEAEKIALAKRKLDLDTRKVAVGERRLAMLEEREKRAVAALTGSSAEKTDAQRLEEIKEIYGLRG